jgi:hypothetical protein
MAGRSSRVYMDSLKYAFKWPSVNRRFEVRRMGLRDVFKRINPSFKRERQKMFYCSNCNREVFLNMKFCDECGGELEWPEEYRHLVEPAKEAAVSAK